ncbi:MAG: hypothetical protein LGB78_04910 [Sulfurovum sp.]|nr:hypothetical protein [Sulfurovum sp.]
MKRGLIGYYEESIVVGEKVRAFVPDVLPPKEEIMLNAQRQRLLERATMPARVISLT